MNQKHIHVVSICGVATSALAVAMKNAGWKVTGSDKGFFPPVSTYLEQNGIDFYPGFSVENLEKRGRPDFVVVGTSSGTKNPEVEWAKENGITVMGYTEFFRDYFISKNSIVVVGTWGKTTSTAMLVSIWNEAGLNPNYMMGGISLSHAHSARVGNPEWSIFEGDEYKSGPDNPVAKFFYYKPTALLITGLAWDHADLYPTEEDYLNAFRKLIAELPSDGKIVACRDNELLYKTIMESGRKAVWYGVHPESDYVYKNPKGTLKGISCEVTVGEETFELHSPILGIHMAENIAGCFALAHSHGIAPEKTSKAISEYKGVKRRLEKRFDGDVLVLDDIAHSADKAKNVLKSLRPMVSGKIIAIFEPNIGGRKPESAHQYANAFTDADQVIIPRLTSLKIGEATENAFDGESLAKEIQKSHANAVHISDDEKLVAHIKSEAKKGDVIIYLGSHGFRRMIEETVKAFEK